MSYECQRKRAWATFRRVASEIRRSGRPTCEQRAEQDAARMALQAALRGINGRERRQIREETMA